MRRFLLSFFAALALACPNKESSPPPTVPAEPAATPAAKPMNEGEPNDTAPTAKRLSEDAIVTGAISAAGKKADEDHFRLEGLGEGKVVDFSIEAADFDVALELLDRDGNHVTVFNSEGQGQGERIARLGLAVPYVVRVYTANKGGQGAYTVTVRFADAAAGEEREPNHRPVDATPLTLGKPVQGYLADKADEDWFRFEVALPTPDLASPVAGQGAEATATPEPQEAAAGALAVPAQLAAPQGDGHAGSVNPEPAGNEGEQQAREAGAAPGPRPALVALDISGVPDVRLQLELANEAEAVFFTARSREIGEGIQVRNVALRPGETTFFAIVKSAWVGSGKDARRGRNLDAPYSLTVSLEESAGDVELESNDELAKATPFSATGTMRGFFSPKGDADYYSVRYEEPMLLKVELSGVDRMDSVLAVVQALEGGKEEVLLRANDGEVREGEMIVNLAAEAGKDLYLKVEGATRKVGGKWVRDQENPDQPYSVTISARPDEGLDEREPNNSPERATPISFGKPLRGLIHPRKDVDYYRVDVSDSPVKVPLKAAASGILKVDIALALYRLGDDGKLVLVQRSESGKGDQAETIRFTVDPGVYLLEVKDTKDWYSNFLDSYQVLLERDQ
ncbi:MAG: ABC transporter substrate-binding protein [Myxococcales bacterium]|jgi:hypothetical protein